MAPVYAWICDDCGTTFDQAFKMADKPDSLPCPCGKQARQKVCIGGVVGDELPTWFDREARGSLQQASERPIASRGELNRYLKDRDISESSARREY